MPNLKIEQRINFKFIVKLKKSLTKCFKLSTEVYKEVTKSCTRVFEWYKRFSEGQEKVDNIEHPNRHSTSKKLTRLFKITDVLVYE